MHHEALGMTVATWIPETVETADEVVDRGVLTREGVEALGVKELPVSHDRAPTEMAVIAARRALAAAQQDPADLGLLAHAHIYHQGYNLWSPAHYIADQLGSGSRTLPFTVQQVCNGGTIGLQMAVNALRADEATCAALVTTADRFGAPFFDRWTANNSMGMGDGATAALVRRAQPGDHLRLLGLAQSAAPELWVTRRTDEGFTRHPTWHEAPVNISPHQRFYDNGGKDILAGAAYRCTRGAFVDSLAHAGLAADDPRIRHVVLPRLGPRVLGMMYGRSVAELFPGKELHFRESTGHLGAGDMLASFADLAHGGWLDAGDIALVANGGGGYTWSCAVVQAPGA